MSNGTWNEASVVRQGAVVARLPFVQRRRFGLDTIGSPPLCPRLGPWLSPDLRAKSFRSVLGVVEELIAQIPPSDLFVQNFSADFGATLPFQWHGFRETTQYSHVVKAIDDRDRYLASLTKDQRKASERTRQRIGIEPIDDMAVVHRLVDLSHRERGARFTLDREVMERAMRAATTRGQARAIGAFVPGRAEPVAALVAVWDARRTYYMFGGLDRDAAPNGAMEALNWQAIEHASTVSEAFDFEGSMIPGIARYFASFPGWPESYPHVVRRSLAASAGMSTAAALARAKSSTKTRLDAAPAALRRRIKRSPSDT